VASTETIKFDHGHLPVWDEHTGTYLDLATSQVLPAWDQALDAIGDQDQLLRVARFGDRFDAQGGEPATSHHRDTARPDSPRPPQGLRHPPISG